MKNKFSLIVSVVLLVVLSAVCGTSVYAWLCVSDNASQMKFQLARINSVVYFYTARDFDFNGIPDLISADDHPVANADEEHDLYYGEKRYFNYVNKREAVAEGTQGDLAKPVDINDFAIHVAPTKIYTAKLSLVNKSDSANDVSITACVDIVRQASADVLYAENTCLSHGKHNRRHERIADGGSRGVVLFVRQRNGKRKRY